jgi:hypothetical protein
LLKVPELLLLLELKLDCEDWIRELLFVFIEGIKIGKFLITLIEANDFLESLLELFREELVI